MSKRFVDDSARAKSEDDPKGCASPPCYEHELDNDAIEAQSWRKEQRQRLLARRSALSFQEQNEAAALITATLEDEALVPKGASIGFYWPMNGEINLRAFVRSCLPRIRAAALPVIVAKDQPLEFWRWDPRTEMTRSGLWGIPAPARRIVVKPTVLFVPLVGFDREGHRLGHGGGYYDRTLAVIEPMPLTIGIGYGFGELESIRPQPHDIAMDLIVTDAGLLKP